jgi:response regulator RpfG family c-di-GMP phosphodiesterase
LAAELLKIRPDVPVIVCTGYSASISEEKAPEAAGIKAFLMKPMLIRVWLVQSGASWMRLNGNKPRRRA